MTPLVLVVNGTPRRVLAYAERGKVVEFYDPDQPRVPKGSEDGGQWTATGDVKTIDDLKRIADVSLPKDNSRYEYFYHALRWPDEMDEIVVGGLQPGTIGGKIFLSKDEIRDRGAGFVVVRIPTGRSKESIDRVMPGAYYRQWTVDSVSVKDVVRTVRSISTGSGGHVIREDELARYALRNQGLRDNDVLALPKKYQAWFNLTRVSANQIIAYAENGAVYVAWDESKHPRVPAGSGDSSGEFVPVSLSPTASEAERLKQLKVPPGWTNIELNPDPDGALLARGLDSKGRVVRIYSAAFSERMAAEKFARLKAFNKEVPLITSRIEKDLTALPAGKEREAAGALFLISRTGIRPGSDTDTGAKVKAFGATTLLAKHVKVEGDTVSFNFTGKKGVSISKTVIDKQLAKELAPRLSRGGRLFQTSDDAVREYLHSRDGEFKVKDFRTWHGTSVAIKEISKFPPPTNIKEFNKVQLAVSKAVAAHLGNTPSVAKSAYIDPAVWQRWGD